MACVAPHVLHETESLDSRHLVFHSIKSSLADIVLTQSPIAVRHTCLVAGHWVWFKPFSLTALLSSACFNTSLIAGGGGSGIGGSQSVTPQTRTAHRIPINTSNRIKVLVVMVMPAYRDGRVLDGEGMSPSLRIVRICQRGSGKPFVNQRLTSGKP